jgi:hypothetical protein
VTLVGKSVGVAQAVSRVEREANTNAIILIASSSVMYVTPM